MWAKLAMGVFAILFGAVFATTTAAQENKGQPKDKPIEEVKNAQVRVKIIAIRPEVELDRGGAYFGSLITVQMEVQNLTGKPVSLTMPSLNVSGEGVTKGGLAFPKAEAWYYGEKNSFTEKWDGNLKAKEKKTIVLDYRKIDRKADKALVGDKDAQVEIVFAKGAGDGLKLLTKKTKVRTIQQQ
jgi:hypothetical protein